MADKPKIAMYWAASCGGCEISLANLHLNLLQVDAAFDLVFCPCLADGKKHQVEALKDGEILITFFNGAIRTDENQEMAYLLRRKSKILVAYGSCAYEGCIPGLSNFHSKQEHFRAIYLDNPSIENPQRIVPQPETNVPEGILTIPAFHDRVKTLSQTVEVDYFLPGCPPESAKVWEVLEAVVQGQPLPPKGAVIGAGKCTVCDECQKKKEDKKVKRLYRTYEIVPDREKCLLEQGILSHRDFRTYRRLYQALTHSIVPPTLLIYLRATVPTLQRRIDGRARSAERQIPASYLEHLNRRYDEWLRRFEMCPVLRIETDELDFAHDAAARREVVELIAQTLGMRGAVQERFVP